METTLNILWINDNPITAKLMVFMYATNALRKAWWTNVHIVVWGATAKLLAENTEIQELVKIFQAEGGMVTACKACADQLGVAGVLESLDVEVSYTGELLTHMIKGEDKLITL